jgi:hypothetical protein
MAATAVAIPSKAPIAGGSANGCTLIPMKPIKETKAIRRATASKIERFTSYFLENDSRNISAEIAFWHK